MNSLSIRMISHLFVDVDESFFVKRLLENISNGMAESLLLAAYPSPFCEEHSLSTEAQEVLTSSFHAFHSVKNLAGELVSDFLVDRGGLRMSFSMSLLNAFIVLDAQPVLFLFNHRLFYLASMFSGTTVA